MSDKKPDAGTISWLDLTIDDAEKVRDFYSQVVGWKSEPVAMKDYDDYCMIRPASDEPTAGICHARGPNADLPAQWLVYITVDNLDKSIATCESLGGKVIFGPKDMDGTGRYCVIKDPAGAVAALLEHADKK